MQLICVDCSIARVSLGLNSLYSALSVADEDYRAVSRLFNAVVVGVVAYFKDSHFFFRLLVAHDRDIQSLSVSFARHRYGARLAQAARHGSRALSDSLQVYETAAFL